MAFALALSVPAHGIAAVVAELCAPDEGELAISGAQFHHHDGDHRGHGAPGSAADGDGPGHDDATGKPHCLASPAASISSFTKLLIAQAGTASPIGASSRSFSGIQPETPHRPPLAV